MSNLTVAVIGPDTYAAELGKKGTSSDITFYNLKRGPHTVTFIHPSRYPERLSSLFLAVSLASRAVLVVDEIDAAFGECVVMLDSIGIRQGFIILRNYIEPGQVAPLIRGTAVESYQIVPDDRMALREHLLMEAESLPADRCRGKPGAVPIDHFYLVKGIGPVVLGEVIDGEIARHDSLRVWPTKKIAQIRSIQKHDDDAPSATSGERVGLALKGVELEDLDRGYVLSANPRISSSNIFSGRAHLSRYWPAPLREGMVIHAGHWMQFLPARVAFVDNSGDWRRPKVTLRSGTELVFLPGARLVLHYLEGGKLRVTGTMVLD
jgi:selenocysteine-specific translation elongation factor